MASEISGIPATTASVMVNKVATQSQGDQREAPRVDQSSGASHSDRVSLTAVAVRISRAEDNSTNQPVFDSKRVDSIRQQIAAGTHRVNAAQVADKMLAFESTLGGGFQAGNTQAGSAQTNSSQNTGVSS